MADDNMRFSEYEKMAVSLDRFKGIEKALKEEWIVTEKIHGANFSCHTDGKDCVFARRRDFLKENEAFYNYKSAEFYKGLPEKVVGIFEDVQKLKIDENVVQVIVFGELFGGKYDHPDLEKTKGKAVQIEIQYCPDVKLITFDIAYRRCDEDGKLLEQEYIDYSDAMEIFDKFQLLYAKPLFRGKACDALNYKIGFDSTVPKELGLPPLPSGKNVAEGIVVRPLKNLMGTDAFGDASRLMVKIKAPEFDETRKQTGDRKKGTAIAGNRPDKQLMPIMLNYITENRMVSAVVKTGTPDTDEIEAVVKEEFINDVMAEMLDDEHNLTLWESCDDKQKTSVRKCLQGKTHGLLMKYKARVLNR